MVVLRFLLMAIVFGPSVSSLSLTSKEFPLLKTQINDEIHASTFNKLLNSIVNTNQRRLDTIKKLTKLQATDIHPSLEDSLRTRRDSEESSDEKDVIYLVIPDTPVQSTDNQQRLIAELPKPPSSRPPLQLDPQTERPQNRPTLKDSKVKLKAEKPRPSLDASLLDANSSINGLSKDGLNALRVSIARSCKSKGYKRCVRACKAAVKNACEEYSCKKRLKKRLNKNCKRECKDEFRTSDMW